MTSDANVEGKLLTAQTSGSIPGQLASNRRMKMMINVDEIRVASPCHARWNDMAGDERERFCGQCSKHVFNLSALTRAQIETLVREREGKFCGRFHRRADGTMLTADCPSRLRRMRMRERLARLGGAVCACLFSLVGCSARQASPNGGEMGQVLMGTPVFGATNPPPEIMGELFVPGLPPPNSNYPTIMRDISMSPNSNAVPATNGAAGK